ncbi:hypothetical protein C0Q70_00305 [Pomacea canaliculata]|uniref:ABC transporter domain-containing protein n=1 Tax=Pomacea canaliculata TaxID=400727 RepID=A0A2T7PW95_POMCA|nr:hypothetical protein C0Q70_00305 [Pomacea canaliculata]
MDSSANQNGEIVVYSPLKGEHLIHGYGDQGQFPNRGYNHEDKFLNRGYNDQGQFPNRGYNDQAQFPNQGYNDQAQFPNQGYNDQAQLPNRGYNDQAQLPNRGYNDQAQFPNQGYNDQAQFPNQGYNDQAQFPNQGYNDQAQLPNRGYNDQAQLPNRGYNDQAQFPNQGYNDQAQFPNRGYNDQAQFPNRGYNDQGQFLNRGFGDQGMSQIRSHDDREERAFQSYLTPRTEDTMYYSSITDIHENKMPNGVGLQRPPALDHDHVIIPAVLSWESITVRVKGKKGQKSSKGTVGDAAVPVPDPGKTQSKGGKIIIDNVTKLKLVASGAGKSTLLNVLTCRNLKSYVLQGEVKVNGVSLGSSIRNISGYVQQDDLFIGTLTVRETLRFRMGLSKCAQTQVGSTGQKRGISGGELKRLSFACEMLTNPPIMFCDEPTSGLDTFMAQNIVQTLQNMASRRRTILCTIHQPSSEIYALFDQLLLMAEGRVAFMGSTKQALEFFSSLNFVCPPNFNPSDFFVLTLAIVPGKEDECKRKVKAICDTFVQTEQGGQIMKDVKQVSSLRRQDTLIEDAKKSESRQVVAVALGLIYLRLTYDQKGSFPSEVPIFLREYGSGLYRVDVYFLSKILAECCYVRAFSFSLYPEREQTVVCF